MTQSEWQVERLVNATWPRTLGSTWARASNPVTASAELETGAGSFICGAMLERAMSSGANALSRALISRPIVNSFMNGPADNDSDVRDARMRLIAPLPQQVRVSLGGALGLCRRRI